MPSQNYTTTRAAAYRYRRAGLSVLPIDIGGAKQPYAALLPFEKGTASRAGPRSRHSSRTSRKWT